MHRVRSWARHKAHGPAPLTAIKRTPVRPLREEPEGEQHRPEPKPSEETGGLNSKPEEDRAATPVNEKLETPQKQNIAVRFFLAMKNILLSSYCNILLVFVPVGIVAHYMHLSGCIVFAMNALGIIPLAGLLSFATESVASNMGDTIGALMNVTFGNAVELIIFIIALAKNEIRIVQASLLGSILANLLLILGMCFLFGGLRYREQMYNSTVTQMSASLLSLSVTSLLLPTAFHASFLSLEVADEKVLQISRGTSIILLLVYGLYLLFQLISHSYLYESVPRHIIDQESVPGPAAQYFLSYHSHDPDEAHHGSAEAETSQGKNLGRESRQPIDTAAASTSAGTPNPRVRLAPPPFDDIEAQTEQRGQASPLRRLPRAISQRYAASVFAMPSADNAGVSRARRQQRTASMPARLNADLNEPRAIPVIVPIHITSPRPSGTDSGDDEKPRASRTTSILLLLGSTGLVAVCAEFMVGAINEVVASDSGLGENFIGLILLPIIGNAAEHVTAVTVAMKNKMDLAIGVALGSSIQIAIFVTPLMVILGWAMDKEMGLYFSLFETISLFVSAFIVNFLVLDGRSNYLEGALLCSAYTIIAVAAFFYPNAAAASLIEGGGG